jgi:hypothetical protein
MAPPAAKQSIYGVSATDPSTFGVVALLPATVALLAGLIPARRATCVEPVRAFAQTNRKVALQGPKGVRYSEDETLLRLVASKYR